MTRYTILPHVQFRAVHDELVIFDPRAEAYLALNASASQIWHMFAQNLSVEDVVDDLTTRYELSRERAYADVLQLANELLERHLVAVAD